MRVLEICPYADWERAERQHIFEARLRGDKMLNIADGGNEPKCSIETRRKNGQKSNNGCRGLINQLILRMGMHARERDKKQPGSGDKFRKCQAILRSIPESNRDNFVQKWIERYPHDKIYEDRKTNSVSA